MKKLIILLILVTFLFISSSQTYEQQSLIPIFEEKLTSKPLETQLEKLEISYWGKTISIEERGYYSFIEFLLRKGAHFFIFGFVAIALYIVLPKWKIRFWLALFGTLILATADEYHQHLTGGRTPSWHDVFLDMCGAMTFLCLLVMMKWIMRKKPLRTQ